MPGADDIKTHLKEAKAALKNQDFNAAVREARIVLKINPENYNALVLEGAALQNLHKWSQSLASFKKAAGINPNSLLAHQGIVSNYEKQGIRQHDDILDAYKNISRCYETEKDDGKYIETTLKLAGVLQSQGEFGKCIKVLARLIKVRGNNVQIAQMAVGVLMQMKEISPEEENMFVSCLGVLHETNTATENQHRKYFQLLYQQSQFSKLEAVCLDLQPKFNSFYHPIDYICRLYLEKRVLGSTGYIMPNFVDRLFKLHPSSTFGYFAQGKILFENGKILDSIVWLKQGLETKPHPDALELLVSALLSIWDFEGVEEHVTKALKKFGNPANAKYFYYALAQAYLGQEKSKEAASILDKVGDELQVNIIKARILACDGRWTELKAFLEGMNLQKFEDWNFDFLRADGKKKNFLALCQQYPENFNVLLLSGIELSKMECFEDSIGIFSKCLELFPKHPTLLTYIAGFYKMEGETETALKYLLNAYESLPCAEIGIQLSDVYFQMDDYEANKELLNKAARKSKKSKSKWAWLRLGMLHLQQGEADEAVVALQAAIRTDHSDSTLWETLADAYYSRGSYEAALKTFERSIQLGAEPTYPKLKMGVIYEHLGEGELALKTLSELGDYTPALLEIAKSWLQIATRKFGEGLSHAVVHAVEESIKTAAKVVQSNEQALALAIIAEACLVGADLNPDTSSFRIPTLLLKNQGKIDEFEAINTRELLKTGINVTTLVIRNSSSKFLAGFQHSLLAKLNFLLHVRYSTDTLKVGLYHAKKAVSSDPLNYTYWNLVAILAEASKDDSLAQHALLKSLSINSKGNAVTWTNWGFLALRHEQLLTANSLFGEAQRFQPSYGVCWIGQGLIAESYDSTEATDITRHAACLEDTHIISGLNYADLVCRTLESPDKTSTFYNYFTDQLDSVHISLEKLALFNERGSTLTSLNLKGILLMHAQQYEIALHTFEQAAALSIDQTEIEVLTRNRLTAYRKLGNYKKSLELLSELGLDDFKAKAAAALAFYKLGDFENAYNLYGDLAALCELDESEKAKIHRANALIAQGISAYRLNGVETAKTLLFRGSELSSTPEGHIVLCSMALSNGELEFAASIVAEMKSKYTEYQFLHEIVIMNAFCLFGQDSGKSAVRSILSYIHQYPQNGKLWKFLSHYLINVDMDGTGARHALLTAYRLGEGLTLPGVALTLLMDSHFEEALSNAQMALVHEPTSLPALAIMVASMGYNAARESKLLNHSVQLARKVLTKTEAVAKDYDEYFIQIREWLKLYVELH